MSTAISAAPARTGGGAVSPLAAQPLLALVIVAAIAAAMLSAGSETAAQMDPDFTRLIRAMAALKALMAGGAAAAIFWRLGALISVSWFGAYAAACAAMASGPVVIWGMAHVGFGAVLLHGGLLASVLLLWRDPAVGMRLSAIVAKRRAVLRTE